MPAANDIAESTSPPGHAPWSSRADEASHAGRNGRNGRNGASAPDRLENHSTRQTARRGGLTITQTLIVAASLLVGTTLLVTATRSGSNGPDPSATAGAVETTRAPVARTAFLDAPTTVAGSAAPSAVVTTAPAAETTTASATETTAATTEAPATTSPSSAPATTPASTAAGGATTVTSSPTITAPAGEVPSQTLPTGQPWPEAILGADGRLVAQGAVPSAANRQTIVAALGLIVGNDHVTDQLAIEATAASVKYVPVRLGAALNFGPGDPDVTEAEKAVLVLWGTFLHDHPSARLLLVARGPKPLTQAQLTLATGRLVAAKRELVAIGADAKQVSTDAVGDATVQNGRLDIALAIG